MTRIRFFLVLTLVVALTAAAAAGSRPWAAHAQGDDTTLPYNEPVIVPLTAGQAVTRTFSAFAGDSFALTLSRLADFGFSAVLIDPQQNASLLIAGPDGNIAQTFESIPQGGVYQLVIQASGAGDLLILLNGSPVEPVALTLGETVVDLGAEPLRFSLTPPEGVPSTFLSIATLAEDPASSLKLPSLSLIDSGQGTTVLSLEPLALGQLSLTLPVPTVFYLSLDPGPVPQQVVITWDVTNGVVPPGDATTPTATIDVTGPCQITFASGVNVRQGPSTAYSILGVASAGMVLPVTGRNGDNSWWQVNYAGLAGWVSAGLATVQPSGNCSLVPVAPAPPLPPTNMPTLTPLPSFTPAPDTPTATVSATPTVTYTPSATWTTGPTLAVTFVPVTFIAITPLIVTFVPVTLGP